MSCLDSTCFPLCVISSMTQIMAFYQDRSCVGPCLSVRCHLCCSQLCCCLSAVWFQVYQQSPTWSQKHIRQHMAVLGCEHPDIGHTFWTFFVTAEMLAGNRQTNVLQPTSTWRPPCLTDSERQQAQAAMVQGKLLLCMQREIFMYTVSHIHLHTSHDALLVWPGIARPCPSTIYEGCLPVPVILGCATQDDHICDLRKRKN